MTVAVREVRSIVVVVAVLLSSMAAWAAFLNLSASILLVLMDVFGREVVLLCLVVVDIILRVVAVIPPLSIYRYAPLDLLGCGRDRCGQRLALKLSSGLGLE